MEQSSVGVLLFILFQTLTSIMLINLLIAMMSSTYEYVKDESLQQWLVQKAVLLQDYSIGIKSLKNLPPFNLFFAPVRSPRDHHGTHVLCHAR